MSTGTATALPKSEPTEPDTSYAKNITKNAKLFRKGQKGEPAIYKIPFSRIVVMKGTYHTYIVGEQSEVYMNHKVIMMVGGTGTGKSTLINVMINYILGVKWQDEFRFNMVDETQQKSQIHSQTQIISSYTIRDDKYQHVPYTLTIIDTPGFGDTRGIDQDKAIVEQIRQFFTHTEPHQVDHIDGICFVAKGTDARLPPTQRYVFDAILALFGKDVQSNILLLATHCDTKEPPVIEAIKEAGIPCNETYFVFNNSALFKRNTKSTADEDSDEEEEISSYRRNWRMGMKSLKTFFEALDQLSPQSLSLTKDVLEERKLLESTAKTLEPQIQNANAKLEQLEKENDLLESHKQEIEANKSFEYEVNVFTYNKVHTNTSGVYCKSCDHTCHHPCKRTRDEIQKCRIMSNEHCIVCPGKCATKDHSIEKFKIEYKREKLKQTYADIERRYNEATGKKLAKEQIVQKLQNDLELAEQAVCALIAKSHSCVTRLQEIALKPHPIGVTEYIDLLIETEKKEAKPGWQSRVLNYEQLKKQEEYLSSPSTSAVKRIWTWGKKKVTDVLSAAQQQ